VNPDIPFREGTKNCINQRMENDIRIGMAGKPAAVGNANPSQHDVVAVGVLMNVKAKAGPYVAQRCER